MVPMESWLFADSMPQMANVPVVPSLRKPVAFALTVRLRPRLDELAYGPALCGLAAGFDHCPGGLGDGCQRGSDGYA